MKIYGKDFELNTSAPSANVSFSLNKENMFAFGFEVPRADVRKPTIIPMGEYCCKYKVMLADGISTPPMQVSIQAISDKNVNLCVETGANVDAPMYEIFKDSLLCGCCRPAEPSMIDIIGKYGIRTIFNLDAQCGNTYTGGYAAFGNFYEPAAGCVKVDAEAMYQPITMKMFRRDGATKGVENENLCEVYHLRCSGQNNGDMCLFGWRQNGIRSFAIGANDIGFAWRWRDFVACANAWWEKNCGFSLNGIPCLQDNTYLVLPNTRESYFCAPWIRYECGAGPDDYYHCVCITAVCRVGGGTSARDYYVPEMACCKELGYLFRGLVVSFLNDANDAREFMYSFLAYVSGDDSKYYGVTKIQYDIWSDDMWQCLDPRGCPILYFRYVCLSDPFTDEPSYYNDFILYCGGGICGVEGYTCEQMLDIARHCIGWSTLGKVLTCVLLDDWVDGRIWNADCRRGIQCLMRQPNMCGFVCSFAWSPTLGVMCANNAITANVGGIWQTPADKNIHVDSCWGTTIDGRPETDTMLEGCSCFPSVANFFSCGIIDTIRRVVLTYNYNISGTNIQSERKGVFTLDHVINYCIYSDNDYNVNYATEYDPNFVCWQEEKDGREPLLSQVKALTLNFAGAQSQPCYLFPITYVSECCCNSGCLAAYGGVGYACACVGNRHFANFQPYYQFISNFASQPLFLLPPHNGNVRCCFPNFIWDVCERKQVALIAGDEWSEDIHALVDCGYGQLYRSLDIRYCANHFITMHNATQGDKNYYSYDTINGGAYLCCGQYKGDLRNYIQNARRECQNAIQITAQSSDTLTILTNGVGSCFVWGGSRWKIVKIDNYNPSARNNCLKVTGFMV